MYSNWLACMNPSGIKRVLREPLVHFLLLGTILFALYGFFTADQNTEDKSHEILLTNDEMLQMTMYFQSQWKRPPTQQEFDQLLENQIQEQILYREALALGLDQDDTIVRRRMAQKMKFLAEDVGAAKTPTIEELKKWYEANSALFAMPGRISFRQIHFSPESGGQRAESNARAALSELEGETIDSPRAAKLGDSIMLQDFYGDRSVEALAQDFGPAFAQQIRRIPPGSWQGPVESGLGLHLVFVSSLEPGRLPHFSEVETEVRNAWLAEQKEIAWRTAYEKMREKYTVLLPAPPEDAPQSPAGTAVAGENEAGDDAP